MNADWFKQREPLVAAAIVLLAIIHGTLYAFTVPPWQHYDEPTHFEYAWLIASTGELPEEGGYDWVFRSRLVRSMIEHDFYRGLPEPDPDDLTTLPPGLEFPQLDDPPLYYLLVSIPLRLSGSPDLADQLIGGRMVSVLLLGLSVFAAWGTMRELTSKGSTFRIFVPLTMALLPTFVDRMSSINNDVGAVAVFSLFLWGSVRLIRRGATPVNLAWVGAAALAAVFTKSTAYLAVPLAVVALVLGILPGTLRRYAWIALGAGALLLGFGLLNLREPAYWYRATSQEGPIRQAAAAAPVGEHALVMDPHAEVTPRWLDAINQPISRTELAGLQGRPVTLGFYMWFDADDPGLTELEALSPEINMHFINGDVAAASVPLQVTRQPVFYRFEAEVPGEVVRFWVSVDTQTRGIPPAVRLYFDGFVLAEGVYPEGAAPEFSGRDAAGGMWGGTPFRNLLRNASAEDAWPAFRPAADNFSAEILPSNVRLSILLYTLLDQEGASWYYLDTGQNMLQTFWARFGWGHVPMPGVPGVYWFFGVLTGLAVVGIVFYPFGVRGRLPVDALLFLGMALLLVWFAALARGAIFIFVERVYQPTARYAFPVIVPTTLALVAGWYAVAHYLKRWMQIPSFYFVFLYLDFFVFYGVIALWNIRNFYG